MELSTRIAWIDREPQHARRALQLIALGDRGWLGMHVPRPDVATPRQGWDVVVLCLAPDEHELPQWLRTGAAWRLLLCLDEAQEHLAARALRMGPAGACLGDYVLRRKGHDHVPELLERIAALLAPAGGAVRPHEARQLAELRTALGSMSQGILQTDPEGRVTVYNQQALEFLDLPETLVASGATLAELTELQRRRGDFGELCELVDGRGRPYILRGARDPSPDLYRRRTRDGRTLEVRTRLLPGGGFVRTFSDVSEYLRVQAEQQRSEERFRSLCALSSDWYWEQDAQLRFTDIRGTAAQGDARLQDWLGRTLVELGALNLTRAAWTEYVQRIAARQPFRELELKLLDPQGQVRWIALSGEPMVEDGGRFVGYRGVGRNITDRKHAEEQIERLAFYDALTGLPNRRLLLDRLQRTCSGLERSGHHAALLFVDLDHFKELNDTRGHEHGDALLVEVAQRLRGAVRAGDTVARFGGDEFVLLVGGLDHAPDQARRDGHEVARKVMAALSRPYLLQDGQHYHSTSSVGMTLFAHPAPAAEELIRQADFAMYQAKAAGRNSVRFFDPGLLEQMRARAQLEGELRRGLVQQELLLYYQPVVDGGGAIIGAEALVRWQHPVRGVVGPGEFIELAERTGLILALGDWVLQAACTRLARWAGRPGLDALVVSVNVSARQFRQPDFAARVRQALRASGARPRQLRLELTESLLLNETEETIAKMESLRAEGVGFSLDDFGTGYSSLSYLKRLPLDQIKIDRAFVRDVLGDPNDAAIVRTILALAHSLDLQVVAEGVETTRQLEFLRQHGCRAFQGYLFGRPAPAEALEQALQPAPA